MKVDLIKSEKSFKEEVTINTMKDAYYRIRKLGKAFSKVTIDSRFKKDDRVKMLKRMISFYEQSEEYEKCSFLMNILKMFGINNFCTREYML
jgi:hypothetical protein